MQLNCVPVYVSDVHYIPWKDEIDWQNIAVLISENQINDIQDILSSISEEKYTFMLQTININYQKYFTLQSVCENIAKRLHRIMP